MVGDREDTPTFLAPDDLATWGRQKDGTLFFVAVNNDRLILDMVSG